ncbi:HNH endonuclease [Nonomuraea wenchangensis]|uniref:HNH endonuclease n=1 Tax=Nonomuraea wenchangensis TaxID=568860 RepID=UPI0037A90242
MRPKHVEWFRVGARTLRAVARETGREDGFLTEEDWYLCPLCLNVMLTAEEFETGELTVEHVPPKALGGKDLVLTCRKCNNEHGSQFDSAAYHAHQARSFASGESSQTIVARFGIDGIESNVFLRRVGLGGFYLTGDPRISNPSDKERLESHMEMLGESGETGFKVTISARMKYDPDRARVSWMRTGYLVAFALLGWKYILRSTLQPIRDHLAGGSTGELPILSAYDAERDPRGRQIWIMQQPNGHECLLVTIGQHMVFLPGPKDFRTLEEVSASIGARANKKLQYSLSGKPLPWPSGPLHLLDPPPGS